MKIFDRFKKKAEETAEQKAFRQREEEYILIDKIKNPYPHYRVATSADLYETRHRVQVLYSENADWGDYGHNVYYKQEDAITEMDHTIRRQRKIRIKEMSLVITYIYPEFGVIDDRKETK